MPKSKYDVIVIGCGHAGCEAAHASARLGAKTLLVALNLDTIAWMPCNPAIGGPAKSHLVKEIDALGGLMGEAADATYLQLKTLNASRGSAVHSLRAQSDKYAYSHWMRAALFAQPNLNLYQALVNEIWIEAGEVRGVVTALGEQIEAKAVVLTSGTFLQGKVFSGKKFSQSGRSAEPAAMGLTPCLQAVGFEFGRLKTGTPARLDKRSIDFSQLETHAGDSNPQYFSFLPDRPSLEQMPCHATRSTEITHQIIRDNIHQSPLYSGMIEGLGPRYCPSIEDKVLRFPDKDSHLFFLEPESRQGQEIYLQGCSTSLPIDVQWQIVQSLPGLENAQIVRPAYAVEYDFLKPAQFNGQLTSSLLAGFYAAGQLLGTSGYEEAAAQGLVAGLNAAKFALSQSGYLFSRAESYIGVLLDDLTNKEINEPYRLMTSRSELRLHLRQDNADRRLTPLGRKLGLVGDHRWEIFSSKLSAYELELKKLQNTHLNANPQTNQILEAHQQKPLTTGHTMSLAELLARPEVNYELIDALLGRLEGEEPSLPRQELDIEIKYAGYVKRQRAQVDRFEQISEKSIPSGFDFLALKHLSAEAREKLTRYRPPNIAQAARIDGVSPADISVLLIGLAAKVRA